MKPEETGSSSSPEVRGDVVDRENNTEKSQDDPADRPVFRRDVLTGIDPTVI